jgi:hypothetical protein
LRQRLLIKHQLTMRLLAEKYIEYGGIDQKKWFVIRTKEEQ